MLVLLMLTISMSAEYKANKQGPLLFLQSALLRAENDERISYIENGIKHWIDSAETFRIQGFLWEDVEVVPPEEITQYPAGEVIRTETNLILPGEREILPDLIPFPLYDFHFSELRGRTILRFSSTYWNGGNGPLILASDPDATHEHHYDSDENHEESMDHAHTEDIDEGTHFQYILQSDGTERKKIVGGFHWHSEHSHYHYDDFAHYIFKPVSADVDAPTRIEKATRCLWDTLPVDLSLPNAPAEGVFRTCKDTIRQGVSVGWGDVYDYTLADQYLDVHDLPPGIYSFSLVIDPKQKMIELRRDNNTSIVIFELDTEQRYFKVLASGAPFQNQYNQFVDGTLLRSDADTKIYTTHNNKKRWLTTEDVLNSYGFLWSDVYIFPQNVVNAIPLNNIVRANNTLYALNSFGYKRAIKDLSILSSYDLVDADIADINETELAAYPDARFVRIAGDSAVYVLRENGIQPITYLDMLRDPYHKEALHVINDVDFENYEMVDSLTI